MTVKVYRICWTVLPLACQLPGALIDSSVRVASGGTEKEVPPHCHVAHARMHFQTARNACQKNKRAARTRRGEGARVVAAYRDERVEALAILQP